MNADQLTDLQRQLNIIANHIPAGHEVHIYLSELEHTFSFVTTSLKPWSEHRYTEVAEIGDWLANCIGNFLEFPGDEHIITVKIDDTLWIKLAGDDDEADFIHVILKLADLDEYLWQHDREAVPYVEFTLSCQYHPLGQTPDRYHPTGFEPEILAQLTVNHIII